MAKPASAGAVHKRLANAIALEQRIDGALAQLAQALDQVDATAEIVRLRAVVREHLAALAEGDPDHSEAGATDAAAVAETGGRPPEVISAAWEGFAAATQAYAGLYTTARVLYEPEVCDLAARHLAHHIDGLRVIAGLLPGALARELNEEGLFCRCICPSCSIGACLCVRNSIATVAEAWAWPGLPMGDGVELRSPPRPGSQLAAADIHEGDRIVSVDDIDVRSNAELQAALRKHQLGETAQLRIERPPGEPVKLTVRHVGDLP